MDRKFLLIQLRFPLPEILFHLPETRNRYWQYPSSINHITRSSLWPSVVGARRWHGFDIGIQYGSRNNTDPLLRLLCKMAGSSWSISSHKSQHEGFLCMHGNIYKLCAGDGMFCDRSERRQCQGYPIERDGCRATEATTTKTAWLVEPWQWQRTQQRNNKRQQRATTTGNRQNNNNDTVHWFTFRTVSSWQVGDAKSKASTPGTPMSGHPTTRSMRPSHSKLLNSRPFSSFVPGSYKNTDHTMWVHSEKLW